MGVSLIILIHFNRKYSANRLDKDATSCGVVQTLGRQLTRGITVLYTQIHEKHAVQYNISRPINRIKYLPQLNDANILFSLLL